MIILSIGNKPYYYFHEKTFKRDISDDGLYIYNSAPLLTVDLNWQSFHEFNVVYLVLIQYHIHFAFLLHFGII